ncbi:D-inositol-3-phosphate glycosyltransferase [subsurface metagenome]
MFEGSSFRYRKLNANDFSPDELIVSMCSRTTFDMYKLPKDIGVKVFYCRGAEIQNWEQILQAWRLPISKIVTATHLAKMIERETNQPVVGVVPNGVNTKEYFPVIPDAEREGVGSIFGWSKAKDPTSIVQVMKMIGQRLPNSPRYLFSGARKPRGIKGVSFKRFSSLQEALRIYSSCRVWFLCSIAEGFGNPILEAMACGCAVVSTNCGGPSDIIKDGVNGFLVDVGNTKAMVHKIVLLYKDKQLRKQICANAMKTVQEYSWPKAVDKLEKCLLSIYANNSRTTTKLYA